MYVIWFILFFMASVQSSVLNIPGLMKTSSNYGPYIMTMKYLGGCGTSETKYVNSSTSVTTENGSYIGHFTFVFTETVRVDELRSFIQTVKNNVPMTLLNFTLANPCQKNSVFIQGFKTMMGSRNCVIKKGEYIWSMNLTGMLTKVYGPQFFYGEYVFQVQYFTQKQQVMCFRCEEIFSKK